MLNLTNHFTLLISPSKVFSISVTMFLISRLPFLFFVRIFISLLTLTICYWMLLILSIRALSILIIVVLNSWSDHLNLLASFGSDSRSVSPNCVFGLLVCLVIFFFPWEPNMIYWVKETAVNRLLVMWWWGVWAGDVLFNPPISLNLFLSLCLWTVKFMSVSQFFFSCSSETGWLQWTRIGYFPPSRSETLLCQQRYV